MNSFIQEFPFPYILLTFQGPDEKEVTQPCVELS